MRCSISVAWMVLMCLASRVDASEPLSLTEPTKWVSAVAVSGDGALYAAGGDDACVYVWDAKTRKLRHRFDAPAQVTALDFRPRTNELAVGCWDGSLLLLDMQPELRVVRRFVGHAETILALDFRPDGKTLASGGADDALRLWDAKSGRLLQTEPSGDEYDVTCVAFSPDGKRLAWGDGEHRVTLAKAELTGTRDLLEGHEGTVSAVAFTSDSTKIVSGSWDDTLRVWDVSDGTADLVIGFHTDDVTAVTLTPDGKQIVSASEDGTLKRFDLRTGEECGRMPKPPSVVTSLAVDRRTSHVIAGGNGFVFVIPAPYLTPAGVAP